LRASSSRGRDVDERDLVTSAKLNVAVDPCHGVVGSRVTSVGFVKMTVHLIQSSVPARLGRR
jgi:hypothetical protein